MNIVAVVVTFNRLELLKECLAALKAQTVALQEIIVINNCSSDGTTEYLATYPGIEAHSLEKNLGGSGGFAEGIIAATKHRPDWIWLMDDDTIPSPTALEAMLPYTIPSQVGFINSFVHWKDGCQHLMNIPGPVEGQEPLLSQLFAGKSCQILKQASFVSLLLRGDIPQLVGLPYREFFIWCDDIEYTQRITSYGLIGVQAQESCVLHATAQNYHGSFKECTGAQAWKLYYGERNESFMRRREKGHIRFWFSQLNKFRLHRHKIKKRHLPKEEEAQLIRSSMRGLWDGLFFYPKIEYLPKD